MSVYLRLRLKDKCSTSIDCLSLSRLSFGKFKQVLNPRPYRRTRISTVTYHGLLRCNNLNCLENTDQSEGMHRSWNRDLASFLSFQHILNDPRYNGTIPERLTRVIQIGRIRRQAEGDLQEGRRLRQRLTRI
ncbi:hypothetical protein PHYBLDRAFT_172486 [Phycomyces blakesleeanus NRRL 1555(-)]|uniref:Uncharacterized protein n=1 Tax=Phycomyces blakesleeanus (strain ATCC 8743b / DSM 1359 / FGSC 10004 / NBRC 33097 / NRRL 1555) TaxID=763407 RepID=A0A162TRP7_PHYB8|nr:hypothetical protein PHYBLDRAFT_172486 [Phycomyces blakesleeanus NRRL 1555(-)]OAD69233.1 hypothetical protein PHYBLDRAFT_172486 [Phycomyces blakesleeanus NRRL 1555(-)]|eukprot:XP_018287273.1 hypothetical protein PHYBLDRAFT_172486 [Phycomyces blakesleeanus NRRL 1555(-)]